MSLVHSMPVSLTSFNDALIALCFPLIQAQIFIGLDLFSTRQGLGESVSK